VEDTYEKVIDEVKKAAKKVTDSDTYWGSDDKKENRENRENREKGGKEPMNPEDIAEHEPTAVKRDKNQGSSGDPV
jgi:hypothetical protein